MPPTGLARYVGPQAAGPTSLALQDQARTNFASGDTATAVGNTIGAAVSGMGHALAAPFVDLDQARAADAQSLGRTINHFAGGLFGVQPAKALPAQVAAQPAPAAVVAPVAAAPAAAVPAPVAAAAPTTVPAAALPTVSRFIGQPTGAPGSVMTGSHIIRDGTGGGPLIIGIDRGAPVRNALGLSGIGGQQNGFEKAIDVPAGTTAMDPPRGAVQRAAWLNEMIKGQTAATNNTVQSKILQQLEDWKTKNEVRRAGETDADYDNRQRLNQAHYVQQVVQFTRPAAINAIPTSNTFSDGQ